MLSSRLAVAAVAAEPTRMFAVPAGEAVETLRLIARQGEAEIVFLTETVRGVRTRPVHGSFTLREALNRLLASTPLSVTQDPKTGGLSVERTQRTPLSSAVADPKTTTMNTRTPRPRSFAALLVAAIAGPNSDAQTSPAPAGNDATVTLSPFEVRTEKDTGYTATSTLAGSRLNTSLRDTPAAISVFTKEFLDDIGAINVTEALEYGLNGSRDTTDYTGNVASSNDLVFQLRGFTGASLGRNYFAWSLSSDSYNIERLDFARGPNSILFGIGGPGGIINTSTKRALIGSKTNEVRVRAGSWDDYRGTLDFGRTLVPGKLAARLNLLWQDRDGWREFDRLERTGAALALTFRPFKGTEIRFDGEYGDVKQVVAQPWPAQERLQPWLDAGRPLSATFGAAAAGTGNNTARQFIYDPLGGAGPISWFGGRVTNTGPTSPALGNNTIAITDWSLIPRKATLTGPGFTGDYFFYNYAFFVEQRLGDFALEAAFNRQSEQRQQHRPQVFNDVALRGDPNAFLPNGRPNPGAGKLYTDGQLQVDYRDQVRTDWRFTGSYALDLRKRSAWLGSHTLAGLLTRRENVGRDDGFNEVNLTPAGDAFYPRDLTNANNQIRRRTYLDFSTSDPDRRGMLDPRKYPINGQNGVTSGLVRTRDASRNDLTRTDSSMAAFQSRWFDGRVVLTGGWRKDKQAVWGSTADLNGDGSTNDDRDPVTRTFPVRSRVASANRSEGDTRTYGIVVNATKQVGLFYNNANNFVPQSDRDIFNNLLGNRKGEGEDMGVRLTLLDGKISGSVSRYKTAEVNRSVGRDNAYINAMNALWQALGKVDQFADTGSRDSQDTDGKGWEYDFTANPTPSWRVSLNFAQTKQITTNIQPRNGAYVEANRAEWTRASALLMPTGFGLPTNATGATALSTIDALYAGFKQSEGQTRRQLRQNTGNFFTSYTIRRGDSRLNGLTLGGGVQYRGDAVVGYDSSRNNAPIYGGAYTLVNAMAAYNLRLSGKYRVRLQLNVDNLLNEDKLQVIDADQVRAYRYVFQTPRRWSITSTVTF
ncbi:MAG: TonB-dependent receptor [Opitutaceae bacterium]|nr:TonB-dependent receptor [Opitutaceae bacterium]